MKGKHITVGQLKTMHKWRAEGFTNVEIAELMGLGESTIYNHLPVGNRLVAKLKPKPKPKRKVKRKKAKRPPRQQYSVACTPESYGYVKSEAERTGSTLGEVVNKIIQKHQRKWWQL